jgi:hypothetical protein
MVLTLHYLSHANALLTTGVPASSRQITGQFIESFCIVAVNVWVLISGYFLSRSGFKLTRILQLLAEVYFYTLGVTLVMNMVNSARVDAGDEIFKTTQFFFPISSEHYSFATAYVLLYTLAPVLNMGVRYMTRKQLKYTILGLLVWFCFIKSLVPVNFVTDRMGYDLNWYICVYLIAAYIRKYDVRILSGAVSSLLLYVFSSLAGFMVSYVLHEINIRTGRFNYYAGVTLHYNYILCLTGALGLFSVFRYIHVREGRFAAAARFLAPLSFGIYLLHEHLEIRNRWLIWMEGIFGESPREPFAMILHLILCIAVLFACCAFVDLIRAVIFKYLQRICSCTRAAQRLKKLDMELRNTDRG